MMEANWSRLCFSAQARTPELMPGRHQLLTVGGHPLPADAENLHTLIAGTTGSGKSTLIEELMDGITARGERVIICDPNASYMRQFAKGGDRLLNPFDSRGELWCLFNEMRRDFDGERLACSVVPAGHGESAVWHHYAQVLLAEILRALLRTGETTTERLMHWSTIAPAKELAELLAGTSAIGLFDVAAEKALASTRFVLTAHLSPHRYLRPGEFSLRRWLEEENGSLYLTWRADMQSALAPLLATWVDIVASAVLSLPPDPTRRIWLVLDELAALGKLNSLESALTLGRKHGLATVVGLQSTAQLERLYGRESATVLRGCFRNLVVLAIAKTDPTTAEELSRALGEREVLREEESRSHGASGHGVSQSLRRSRERLVMPSEIAGLPSLQGFFAVAGDAPIKRVTLAHRDRETVIEPFVEEAAC